MTLRVDRTPSPLTRLYSRAFPLHVASRSLHENLRSETNLANIHVTLGRSCRKWKSKPPSECEGKWMLPIYCSSVQVIPFFSINISQRFIRDGPLWHTFSFPQACDVILSLEESFHFQAIVCRDEFAMSFGIKGNFWGKEKCDIGALF